MDWRAHWTVSRGGGVHGSGQFFFRGCPKCGGEYQAAELFTRQGFLTGAHVNRLRAGIVLLDRQEEPYVNRDWSTTVRLHYSVKCLSEYYFCAVIMS